MCRYLRPAVGDDLGKELLPATDAAPPAPFRESFWRQANTAALEDARSPACLAAACSVECVHIKQVHAGRCVCVCVCVLVCVIKAETPF